MLKRTRSRLVFGVLAALSFAVLAPVVFVSPAKVSASSHREAPLISQDPTADATDLYAFVSPDKAGTVTFVTNWIPYENPASGPNFFRFGDDVLYELHIDNVGDSQDHISFEFQFKTTIQNGGTFLYDTGPVASITDANLNVRQTMTVTRLDAPKGTACKDKPLANCHSAKKTVLGTDIPVAPANVGPHSFPMYDTVAAQAIKPLSDGSTVFAGPRGDSFFADIGSLFDLLTIRKGVGNQGDGVNSFTGYNVHTISLQIPIKNITNDGTAPTDAKSSAAVVGSWITSSRQTKRVLKAGTAGKESGAYVQIERLGMPLVNEVVVPLALKDAFNSLYPWQDAKIPAVVAVVLDPEPARLLTALYKLPVPPAPRKDVETVFLTGVPGLNQPTIPASLKKVTQVPSEQLRLNVAIPPTSSPKRLGVLAGDLAGFPNGRRLTDDVVDEELQVLDGVLVDPTKYNVPLGDGVDAPAGTLTSAFPYQATPYDGFNAIP